MMQQASLKFGFEAEDIPLMIEAIPLNSDCIVLIITKVEDPEELDTRFSKFAPSVHDDDSLDDMNEGADDVLDLFKRIHEGRINGSQNGQKASYPDAEAAEDTSGKEGAADNLSTAESSLNLTRIYSFDSLNHMTRLAHILNGFYHGVNSLYKDAGTGRYFLIVTSSSHTPEEFNKLCNCLSEYGRQEKSVPAGEAYFEEHYELIISEHALQSLSKI